MIKSYREIMFTPDDKRTEDEKIRFARASMIPKGVRYVLEERASILLDRVRDLEKERDEIIDFLNGFWGEQ